MEITQLLSEKNEGMWDKFVREAEDATFWHQIGWKRVIEKTFGHRAYYLMAKENNEIRGVLPLFFIKTPFLGNFLVSVPFMTYGGVVSNMDKEVDKLLIDRAIQITKELKADYLELRALRDYGLGLEMNHDYFTFVFPLERNSLDEAWGKDLPYKKRRRVRKAKENGVEIRMGQKYLKDFFEVFYRKWREFGTPSYGFDFFENIRNEFEDDFDIIVAEKKGKIIGAHFLVFFKETIEVPWGGSPSECFNLRLNESLYWGIITHGYERGFSSVDYGRSAKNSGIYLFKEEWGASPKPLYYQYYLNKRKGAPRIHPTNPKYRLYINIWKKLPIWLTRRLGPKIIRYIP